MENNKIVLYTLTLFIIWLRCRYLQISHTLFDNFWDLQENAFLSFHQTNKIHQVEKPNHWRGKDIGCEKGFASGSNFHFRPTTQKLNVGTKCWLMLSFQSLIMPQCCYDITCSCLFSKCSIFEITCRLILAFKREPWRLSGSAGAWRLMCVCGWLLPAVEVNVTGDCFTGSGGCLLHTSTGDPTA